MEIKKKISIWYEETQEIYFKRDGAHTKVVCIYRQNSFYPCIFIVLSSLKPPVSKKIKQYALTDFKLIFLLLLPNLYLHPLSFCCCFFFLLFFSSFFFYFFLLLVTFCLLFFCLIGTKGLSKIIIRRQKLCCRFSVICLNDMNYCKVLGSREAQLLNMNSDLHACYLRWVEYTQESKVR